MSTIIKNATIVAGSSMTDGISLNEYGACGIITGSTILNTTMTMLVSADGITYSPLYTPTGEYTVTTSAGSSVAYNFGVATMCPFNFVKFRLGTSASPINHVGTPLSIQVITKSW